MKNNYDYKSSWYTYCLEQEKRFISHDEIDLLKICDCYDTSQKMRPVLSGFIPVRYQNDKLYVLKDGIHAAVQGETGTKKSRTICRGSCITAIHSGSSFIVIDPKGEISGDTKIQGLLQKYNYNYYCLDFRTKDKHGINVLGHISRLYKEGYKDEAKAMIPRFSSMLYQNKKAVDDFWNDNASDRINIVLEILLVALGEKKRLRDFHLASLQKFIGMDKVKLETLFRRIMSHYEHSENFRNPLSRYYDLVSSPAEKTYSSIIQSVNALLKEFCRSESLLRMLCTDSFDVRKIYTESTAIFITIPDETSEFNFVSGFILDLLYQSLIQEYTARYQGRISAPCNIRVICDEAANIVVPDLASKISASRSRQITWILLYQSNKQLKQAYEKDYDTINGNTKIKIFLGSSDYSILEDVSESCGKIQTFNGYEPLVPVSSLRAMEKHSSYKDALITVGNYLYAAQLPDYESFRFLSDSNDFKWKNCIPDTNISSYTPEKLLFDLQNQKIKLNFSATNNKYHQDTIPGSNTDELNNIKPSIFDVFDTDE